MIGMNSCVGGCNVDDRIYPYYIPDPTSVCTPAEPGGVLPNLPPAGTAYECLTNKMHSAPMWLGLGGLAIMTILMARNVKAAIIIGISVTTVIAWLPGHGASYLGHTSNIPGEGILQRGLAVREIRSCVHMSLIFSQICTFQSPDSSHTREIRKLTLPSRLLC